MARPEIIIKTFNDYTPTVVDNGKTVPNKYYPDYSYWAHDDLGSLVNPHSIIIHSMCVPADVHPSGQVSTDPYDCKNLLEREKVSTHYLIPKQKPDEETGSTLIVYQMVQDSRKAWHAYPSVLPNLREGEEPIGLNSTGIGVELLQDHDSTFTDEQYLALVGLVVQLIAKYPIENILGHYEVSGDDVRGEGKGKTDPEGFDWEKFLILLADALNVTVSEVTHYRSRVA